MRLARAQRLTGIGRHNCGAKLLIHEMLFKPAFPGEFGPSQRGGFRWSVHAARASLGVANSFVARSPYVVALARVGVPQYPTISRFKTFDRRQPEALGHNAPSAAIRYEHPWRAALTVSLYRSVDSLGVVGRVCRDPCQRALDLLEQRGYTSRIASLAASQITGGDITSIRIDDKVELAPSAVLGRLAHVPAMNLDAGTVHEDVNRLVMAGPVERDLAESLGTSREGCLVRNL